MFKRTISEVVKELEKVVGQTEEKVLGEVIRTIFESNRIFVVGSGRSALTAKWFAHRIVDLGFDVFVVGETITPSAKKNDAIVAVSGSGETTFTLNVVEIGKKIGAHVIAITSYPNSPIGNLADVLVELPGRVLRGDENVRDYLSRQITGVHEPLNTKGGVFELATLVLFESLLVEIRKRKEEELKKKAKELRSTILKRITG